MATVLEPQQPTLRPFIVYDEAPAGCIPFLVTNDDTAPHLRPGDVALVDTTDRVPADDLFVVRNGDRACLRELQSRHIEFVERSGKPRPGRGWFVTRYNRPRNEAAWREAWESGRPIVGLSDGPYAEDGPLAGVLPSKLVGRVVGILVTRFAEPLYLSPASRSLDGNSPTRRARG
ncbi:hypothetical protein Q5H91_03620 [Sphingomonas sp. KR1UV-12]|uniref:Peptidase S26 domain-containing protein n=1 Tax=Sphingomonas aurea TaxID=3063994 RepID=A0ABT9EH48_9SPHN|nr:hypothetical protein [Sphingomonas sp. KR1UV-12]MDP1026289.1 hypothetical protein [Sphingomonas sp. KR1UV-12]